MTLAFYWNIKQHREQVFVKMNIDIFVSEKIFLLQYRCFVLVSLYLSYATR